MRRIEEVFRKLRKKGDGALIAYVTGGDPDGSSFSHSTWLSIGCCHLVNCIVMELGEYPELWPIVIKVGRPPNPSTGVIVV